MRKWWLILFLCVLVSCEDKEAVISDLTSEREILESQNKELEAELKSVKSEIDAMQKDIDQLQGEQN